MSPGLVASAPTRIDLAGGTLDIPPLHLFHQPAVTVNVAIDLWARVSIRRTAGRGIGLRALDQGVRAWWPSAAAIDWRRRPFLELLGRLLRSFDLPGGIEVTTECRAPAGAGTGGSSALAIAATAALARLTGRRLTRAALIEHAKGIETQAIRVPTGYQDYLAAVYGGAHAFHFELTGIRRTRLGSAAFLRRLEAHLVLAYVGTPRFSGANNWELFRRHLDGERRVVGFFEALRENALGMREAFAAGSIRRVARHLDRDWAIRRRMIPTMTTPEIDRLMAAARRAGALAGRVCGAGGGGCIAFLAPPAARDGLIRALRARGAGVLPCRIHRRGLTVRQDP